MPQTRLYDEGIIQVRDKIVKYFLTKVSNKRPESAQYL